VYKYRGVTYDIVDLAYGCEVKDASKAKPSSDVRAVLFKSRAEVKLKKFAFKSIRRFVGRYFVKT